MLHHGRRGILGKPAVAESEAVAAMQNGGTTPIVYKWSASGFGTRYATASTTTGSTYKCAFSPDGKALAVLHGTSPFITAYAFNAVTGCGAKYSNPATLPVEGDGSLIFSPAGDAVLFSQYTDPFVAAYRWDSTTGFGTKYANPATALTSTGSSISMSPDGTAVVIGCFDTPRVNGYQWSSASGFGTRYTNPTTPPNNGSENDTTAFSPSGNAVVVGSVQSPFVYAYPWNSVTGFGTKYADPSTALIASIFGATFSRSGNAIILLGGSGSVGGYIAAYAFNATTGFGTKYANPVGMTGAMYDVGIQASVLSALGDTVFFGGRATPYIHAYPWSDATGFGTKHADPTSLPTNRIRGLAFRKIPV